MGTKNGRVGVLFVDDDVEILGALEHLVKDEDFAFIPAASGTRALEILAAGDEIGVIVSDQKMPEMSGLELLERAWEICPDCLRIMLTGYGDPEIVNHAISKGGAYRFITKPWKNQELLQSLRDAVTIYKLMKENRRLTSLVQGMKQK